jgi:hypothetical protein
MVLNVSNDEPTVMGETNEQRQLHEQRNADHAEHRQHEVEEEEARRKGARPRDLANAFDRVGDRQVFRTPSANVAVAMANLDRLPDTLENHATLGTDVTSTRHAKKPHEGNLFLLLKSTMHYSNNQLLW